jgi:hypothetical protein
MTSSSNAICIYTTQAVQSRIAGLPPDVQTLIENLPADLKQMVEQLPDHLWEVVEQLPPYVDRRQGASIVSQNVVKTSHRSLEVWPLPWRQGNGRATTPPAVLLAVAYNKLIASPVVMGGRRASAVHQAPVAASHRAPVDQPQAA